MKIQDALDLHLKEEASRIIGEYEKEPETVVPETCTNSTTGTRMPNHAVESTRNSCGLAMIRVREVMSQRPGLRYAEKEKRTFMGMGRRRGHAP